MKRFKKVRRLHAGLTWTPFEEYLVSTEELALQKTLFVGLDVDWSLFAEGSWWRNNRYQVHKRVIPQEGHTYNLV